MDMDGTWSQVDRDDLLTWTRNKDSGVLECCPSVFFDKYQSEGMLEGIYDLLPPSLKLKPGEDYRHYTRFVLNDVVGQDNSKMVPKVQMVDFDSV